MFFVDVVASGLHAAREKWHSRDGRCLILREREVRLEPRSKVFFVVTVTVSELLAAGDAVARDTPRRGAATTSSIISFSRVVSEGAAFWHLSWL